MRQVVLDTETTGLDPASGHRVIEIGCVELMHRRYSDKNFHRYINPERAVDAGALAVHGIEEAFLAKQPKFAEIAADFVEFVTGAELVIHNAAFDVGFINHELSRLEGFPADIREICEVRDTLSLARRMHPGQRNSLDALAKRYDVDNSMRELHGALLDAKILAEVYLAMTGGQVSLSLDADAAESEGAGAARAETLDRTGLDLVVLAANDAELDAHDAMLERMRQKSEREPIWDRLAAGAAGEAGEADTVTKSP
jgi:DNA polymerase-3 subunit epsilon